jgi:hypothetical protein
MPNKRIKLSRRGAGGLTGGRRARSLSAVRWAHVTGPWGEPMPRSIMGRRP